MKHLLDKIDSFIPEKDDIAELESLLEALLNTETPERGMVNLFKAMERFPEKSEVELWNIIYGIEDMEGFEQEFVNSLKRYASPIGMMHLHGIYNAGATKIGDDDIKNILLHIKNNPNTSDSTLSYIKDYFC